MPRLIPKPNGKQPDKSNGEFSFFPLPASLHADEDSFLKACQKRSRPRQPRRHTVGSIDTGSASPRGSILNDLLSSLMIPFRMTGGGDQEAPDLPSAVSYDDEACRDRLEASSLPHDRSRRSHVHVDVDPASSFPRRDEERSAFAHSSASHRPSASREQREYEDPRRSYSGGSSPMPVQIMPPAASAAAAPDASARPQFERGTPRHPHSRSPPDHSYSFPQPHHHHPYYGYPPHQPYPPYDYSGYYHHQHSSEGDLSGASPYHAHPWPEQHAFHSNYSPSYQEYAHHSYYSSSPHSYPSHHASSGHHHPEDPYSSSTEWQRTTTSTSPHPHSAPPSYHRTSAYASASRSTPPLDDARDNKHPSSQQYKETPSAITEGTTPSKLSPPLELSPEMSALFRDGSGSEEDERKPAAREKSEDEREEDDDVAHGGRTTMLPRRSESTSMEGPSHDDYEPIPLWNDGRGGDGVVASSSEGHYGGVYPVASASGHPDHEYRSSAAEQHHHHHHHHAGLSSQYGYPCTPTRSAEGVAAMPSGSMTLSSAGGGGEGSSWEKRFAELIEFRSRFGHCEVPQNYKDNTSLGIWVNKQRMEQKNRMEGKNSSLNDARLQRLESVGFRWAKRKGQASWDEKFNELKAYKKKHGNCHVPTKYKANTALGRWVSTQRAEYKKFCEGDEKTSMTRDKIRRLEEIGFAWFMAL